MPATQQVRVDQLLLDLNNFRTVPQKNETEAIIAMVSVSPDNFWALMESLIDDGYLPTDNIIVLKSNDKKAKLIVKEGNRRIASLKLVFGYLKIAALDIPDTISQKIKMLSQDWKDENQTVPCTVYENNESATVDKVVTLAHGKAEKAGRDQWSTVARARHNRDVKNGKEPALDLLEKYLTQGQNLNGYQKDRWAGDFPLSVLDEAIKKVSIRFNVVSAAELAKNYPSIINKANLEALILDIGLEIISFKIIRDTKNDFADKYGIKIQQNTSSDTSTASSGTGGTSSTSQNNNPNTSSGSTTQSNTNATASSNQSNNNTTSGKKATATTDPKTIIQILKKFSPKGSDRAKVVTLKNEASNLNIDKTPIAFCFLLRSLFEISGKAYGSVNNVLLTKSDGTDRKLIEVLRDCVKKLTNNDNDKTKLKELHGAIVELAKSDGILSVTSMNQLVHNPTFSVTSKDISTLFCNIYPLLESLNS